MQPPERYAGWSRWYAPGAAVPDQPHLARINELLPFLGAEDVEALTRQMFVASKGAAGPYAKYLQAGAEGRPIYREVGGFPAPPTAGEAGDAEPQIRAILRKITDPVARAWAQAVFDVYRDWTPQVGMRGAEEEAVFQAQLEELFGQVPDAAQPYAATLQRLVQPTVRAPAREWYEMPEAERTAPTHWGQIGYRWNPAWM